LTDVVKYLKGKGIPLAVASSSVKKVVDIILQKTGLKEYFSFIVTSADVEDGKPAPDIYLHTASLLNVKPEDCLVVEDSFNGIKAAKSAGMFCVAYTGTTHGSVDKTGADMVIKHFDELLLFLKEKISMKM